MLQVSIINKSLVTLWLNCNYWNGKCLGKIEVRLPETISQRSCVFLKLGEHWVSQHVLISLRGCATRAPGKINGLASFFLGST